MSAPLSERLKVTLSWVQTISLGREWVKVRIHLQTLQEAVEALRSAEDKQGTEHDPRPNTTTNP